MFHSARWLLSHSQHLVHKLWTPELPVTSASFLVNFPTTSASNGIPKRKHLPKNTPDNTRRQYHPLNLFRCILMYEMEFVERKTAAAPSLRPVLSFRIAGVMKDSEENSRQNFICDILEIPMELPQAALLHKCITVVVFKCFYLFSMSLRKCLVKCCRLNLKDIYSTPDRFVRSVSKEAQFICCRCNNKKTVSINSSTFRWILLLKITLSHQQTSILVA